MSETENNGGVTGRDDTGRFGAGNTEGKGRPKGAKNHATIWREAFNAVVTSDELEIVTRKLMDAAKAGQAWAIREINDRSVGRPAQSLSVTADVNVSFEDCLGLLRGVKDSQD